MDLSTLGKFLLRNGARLHWRYLYRMAYLLVAACWNSYLGLFEKAINGEGWVMFKREDEGGEAFPDLGPTFPVQENVRGNPCFPPVLYHVIQEIVRAEACRIEEFAVLPYLPSDPDFEFGLQLADFG